MLTPNQMAELIKRIFNINYPEDAQLNDSKNFLIDFLKLNYDAKKLFRISVSFLNIRSTAGFEIFIWLSDNLPIKFSSYSIRKIFDTLASLSNEFESDLMLFEVCMSFLRNISGKSVDTLKKYVLKMPSNIILLRSFDFLLRYFEEDFILDVIYELLKKPGTSKRAIDFYFKNGLFASHPDLPEQIVKYFGAIILKKPDFIAKEGLTYFMTSLFRKPKTMTEVDKCAIVDLIISFIDKKLPIDIFKTYEQFVEEFIFDLTDYKDKIFRQTLISLIDELKGQGKEDYYKFDLTSEFFTKKSNLEALIRVLKPESIFPAFKIICSTSKNFGKVHNKNDREDLYSLITIIVEKCPKKRELLDILASSLPYQFKFLVKAHLIVSSKYFSNMTEDRRLIRQLEVYLLENLDLPKFIKSMTKSNITDLLRYLSKMVDKEEEFLKLKMIAERIETSKLIDFYEKMIGFN